MQRRRAGAAGRGDHVAQLGGVQAARLGEERAALERLDDQVVGDVAREAEVDGGVDQRFHDQEDVGRAGAADGGGHGDQLLVVDLHLLAQRAEQYLRLLSLRLGDLGRGVPDGHAPTELRRRVGHAAHDLAVAQSVGQRLRAGAGDDADHELPLAQAAGQLASDPAQHLRLDRQHDDIGVFDRRRVLLDGTHTVRAHQLVAPLEARVAGDDLLGADELGAQQAGDHGFGHDARADGRDGAVGERHRPSIRSGSGPSVGRQGQPGTGGKLFLEAARVEQLGQQRDAFDDARPGPREVRCGVEREDIAAAHRAQVVEEVGLGRRRPLDGGSRRCRSRTASASAGRGRRRGRAPTSSRPTARRPGRAAPSRPPDEPARAPSGRQQRVARAIRGRRRVAAHAGQPALEDAVLDRAQPLAQQLEQPDRLVLGVGHRADRGNRVEDALDRARLETDQRCVRADLAQPGRDLVVADRADLAQALGQNQVGRRLGQGTEVEAVDRVASGDGVADQLVDAPAAGAGRSGRVGGHDRDSGGVGREVALVRPTDQLVAQAEREHDLGSRGKERDDAHGWPGRRSTAGSLLRPAA